MNRSRRRKGSGPALTVLFLLAVVSLLLSASYILPGERVTVAEATETGVRINEIMAVNSGACIPADGVCYDWIELVNEGDTVQDLTGWKLADDPDLKAPFTFGSVSIAPGEYLIVYATGGTKLSDEYIAADFGLSSGGETVVLADASGNKVDQVTFPSMTDGEVYARTPGTDTWSLTGYYTPGLENTQEAYEAYVFPDQSDRTLVISEVMAHNTLTVADPNGGYYDWIELWNRGTEPISLEGYALTDSLKDARKFLLPDLMLGPDEVLLVYAAGKDGPQAEDPDTLYASFALSRGETVRLTGPDGCTVSWVVLNETDKDTSIALQEDGIWLKSSDPTPGFANTAEGLKQFRRMQGIANEAMTNSLGLYINEVMACASSTDDWVELYNASGNEIDLSGFGLSDSTGQPFRYIFPDGITIKAGGYLLVSCDGSGAVEEVRKGKCHAAFGLSARGDDVVVLTDSTGKRLDLVLLNDVIPDVSFGRADGRSELRYFADPTPGAQNSASSYAGRTQDVVFSVNGGHVSGAQVRLELKSEPGAVIYYTADGSQPGARASVYSEPIVMTDNTVIRAVAVAQDKLPSADVARTYLFGEGHTVRIVCVSGRASELTGSGGALKNTAKTRVDVAAEFYDTDGTLLLMQDCEFRLNGRMSRTQFDQKGFRLTAKTSRGDNRFRASLFTNRDYTEYKSVVLRASGQDNERTRMLDSVLTSLAADTRVMYQETEVCVVYVNGKYWGQYNLRERINEQSVAQFEGWSDTSGVQVVEGKKASGTGGADLRSVINSLSAHSLESDEKLEEVSRYIDIDNYLDYVALQMFISNQDLNNVRMYRNTKGDNLWRWVIYDTDLSFQVDANSIKRWMTPGGVGSVTSDDNTLFIALMNNSKVRDRFLTRMGELLATAFSSENVCGKIMDRYDILRPEMDRHCKRWNWSVSKWDKQCKRIYRYATTRPGKLMGYFKDYLDLTDEDMQHYFGPALEKAEKWETEHPI